MTSLSVIIITKNEANNIEKCLESVKFANEIIVLDSGSTDNTIALAKNYTAKVFQTDWPGYGAQKNRALDLCQSRWILSLDADEQISPQLVEEIQKIMLHDPIDIDAFLIPRKSKYCKQWIRFGDWRDDYCLRLFRRNKARFKEIPVHENLIVNGQIRKMRGEIHHDSFVNLEEVLDKINHYSTLSAHLKFNQGKKTSLLKAVVHGIWTFFRGYILKFGFLDGKKGFMLAVSNAEGCYYRYVKMMLLDDGSSQ